MGETEREFRKRMWLCPMAICFCGGTLWKRQAQNRDRNCAILCGNFVNIKDCSMLSGQWIRLCLRSSDRGFESQSHHQIFYQFIFESCHVEKTKRNTKEAVIKKVCSSVKGCGSICTHHPAAVGSNPKYNILVFSFIMLKLILCHQLLDCEKAKKSLCKKYLERGKLWYLAFPAV